MWPNERGRYRRRNAYQGLAIHSERCKVDFRPTRTGKRSGGEKKKERKKQVKHLQMLRFKDQSRTSGALCDEIDTTTGGGTYWQNNSKKTWWQMRKMEPAICNRAQPLVKEICYNVLCTPESDFERFANRVCMEGAGDSCQQLNTEGAVLWRGMTFQPQEQVN